MTKNKSKVIEPIKIWRFEDAPLKYQDMSINGGDEDWVAEVPVEYPRWFGTIPMFMREGTSFACCKLDVFDYEINGKYYRIFIGSHA
jgi:hypothetical protein